MKKGYLIYTKFEANRNEKFIKILIEASNKNGLNINLLLAENLSIKIENNIAYLIYDNKIIERPDFVIQRSMNYILSKQLELMGIRVFNSSEVSLIADNKFNAYLKMVLLGIPVLKTILQNVDNKNNLFFPNVTKPIDSKGGDRVNYNKNIDEYMASIKSFNKNFILQEPSNNIDNADNTGTDIDTGIDIDIGKDLRVYVIGKKIITSILRISNSGFLSTYCKGGSASIYKLNNEEKNIVEKIVNNINFDYVGIDFLFNNGKLVFNEIENVVGARMVYALTDINIGEKFISYISTQI